MSFYIPGTRKKEKSINKQSCGIHFKNKEYQQLYLFKAIVKKIFSPAFTRDKNHR